MQHNEAPFFDRLLAAGSYLTLGTVGMIWFLINFIVLKKPMERFLTYNLVQSFIISILFAIISLAYSIFIGILVNLPFVGGLFLKIHVYLFDTPVFNTMSLLNYIIFLFVCYLSILAMFGKLPYVPFVTDTTKRLWR